MNIVRDQVTDLTIQLFRGNSLAVRFTVLDDDPMPSNVTSKAFYIGGTHPLNPALQPTVVQSGRVFTITYPASLAYPDSPGGYHEIYFDGRKVIAGLLSCNRGTVNAPSEQDLTVIRADGVNILLKVLAGGGGGGDYRTFNFTSLTNQDFEHNMGTTPIVRVIDTSGKEIAVAIQHAVNKVTLTSNQPVSGKLICNT